MAKRIDSRAKGAAAEREAAAAIVNILGCSARRGVQYQGGPDSPDILTDLPIHWECKRVERGNPYNWLDQACRDAGGNIPVVVHRRNRREWILIMRLEDAPRFAATLSEGRPVAAQEIPCAVPGKDSPRGCQCHARQAGGVVLPRGRSGCNQATEGPSK